MPELLADCKAETLTRLRRALRAWYSRHARPLPWRKTADPYVIWISEIMLQQTTVAAVVPYFDRFVKRFPTLESLASAAEKEVLRRWEGLGYYSRARNLHRAARILVRERGGRFPNDVAELLTLPGIGRYTAGAIASFAFDKQAPILEANTLRLYCRLLDFGGDPRSAAGQKLLWGFAGQIVPRRHPGTFNQSLMELGATVCTVDEPRCSVCPVRGYCAAFSRGRQTQIPIPLPRAPVTEVTEVAVAIQRDGRYLLIKRLPGERWAGLWDFVRFAWEQDGRISPIRLAGAVYERTGLKIAHQGAIAEIRHSVTRFRINLSCHWAQWMTGELDGRTRHFRWVAPSQFARFPLSTTGRKFARLLQERGAQ